MSKAHHSAVLLDRQPLWLEAVELVLARIDVRVAGKATAPTQALALIGAHRPDVFVTGIKMAEGEIDGIECITQARGLVPDLRSVVLSAHTETEYIDKALDAGAVAYVVKSAHPDDLDFGAAATLAGFRAAGLHIELCIVTDGDAGGFDSEGAEAMTARRHAEQRAAAAVVGAAEVHFLGERDGHLEPDHGVRRKLVARAGGIDLTQLDRVPDRLTWPLDRDMAHPVPRVAALRDEDPVSKLITFLGMDIWLVTGADEAREVLGEDEGARAVNRLRRLSDLQALDVPVIVMIGGSTGTGKSTVAAMFAAQGIPVFDADAAVHRLQGPGGRLVAAIEEAFTGTTGEGGVNRTALAELVLADPARLAQLEAIVHPAVAAERAAFLAAHADADLVVLDIVLTGRCGLDVPVLPLGACDSEVDRVVGFELRADDFVPKAAPCSSQIFCAAWRTARTKSSAGTLGDRMRSSLYVLIPNPAAQPSRLRAGEPLNGVVLRCYVAPRRAKVVACSRFAFRR